MKRSAGRILTTHVGSLPRPDDLLAFMTAKSEGRDVDEDALAGRVRTAVAEVVRRQAAIGLDVINDGEMSKVGFIPYVNERLAGFDRAEAGASGGSYWGRSREARAFPDVGRENVIAGADCGFASFATSREMHPSIVWAKLQSLVEGAQIASRKLWEA